MDDAISVESGEELKGVRWTVSRWQAALLVGISSVVLFTPVVVSHIFRYHTIAPGLKAVIILLQFGYLGMLVVDLFAESRVVLKCESWMGVWLVGLLTVRNLVLFGWAVHLILS